MIEQLLTKEYVMEELKKIKDPEIGQSIVDLGLIYEVTVVGKNVRILLTFTSPFCPVGDMILDEVNKTVSKAGGTAKVDVTFEPPWSPSKISPELRAAMGIELEEENAGN